MVYCTLIVFEMSCNLNVECTCIVNKLLAIFKFWRKNALTCLEHTDTVISIFCAVAQKSDLVSFTVLLTKTLHF